MCLSDDRIKMWQEWWSLSRLVWLWRDGWERKMGCMMSRVELDGSDDRIKRVVKTALAITSWMKVIVYRVMTFDYLLFLWALFPSPNLFWMIIWIQCNLCLYTRVLGWIHLFWGSSCSPGILVICFMPLNLFVCCLLCPADTNFPLGIRFKINKLCLKMNRWHLDSAVALVISTWPWYIGMRLICGV